MVYTSIKFRKFIAYIYIYFNQNLDERSYISDKNESVKHLHAVLLLIAEHRQWRNEVATSIQTVEKPVYFDIILSHVTSHGSILSLKCKLRIFLVLYSRMFQ